MVLADLSLDNPNVFYELGIRHVMSSSGTILICRNGSTLPFDVKLSRVIFYEFDGVNIDWEEVERIVPRIKLALEEAQKGLPDSPVHAFLPGSLIRADKSASEAWLSYVQAERCPDAEPLADYQRLVAEHLYSRNLTADDLLQEQQGTVFGCRALAYLCLKAEPLTDVAIARLSVAEQYRLANELYSRLYKAKKLGWSDLLAYASSYSEANPDLAGADHAIALVEEAFKTVKQQYSQRSDANVIIANAACHGRLAGLRQWRWQLSREETDLDLAISAVADAILHNDNARNRGEQKHPGFLAQARLRHLVLLRIRDQNRDRPDSEGHLDAILALHPQPRDDPRGLSYLGWFQAMTLADLGAAEEAQRKALKTFADDARLKTDPEYSEIGRRQYVQLRRFLEQYAPYLRTPSITGRISQILQTTDHAI